MTTPNTQSFDDIVSGEVTAIQGATAAAVDLSIGSVLRAVVEAFAGVALWLEGLILQLLATTRAATSNASDLDSWMADFGLVRLPAVAATGAVTFSRFTPTLQATIPLGATVQTADGSQTYMVTLDTTNAAWNAGLNAYVLAPTVASITIPVVDSAAGAAGNAAPGFITTITQALTGVDTATNALQFTTGADAETDAAFRLRFIAYVASLSRATRQAIGFALTSLQTGVTFGLYENVTYAGATQNDYFYAVVDDGTGYPSSAFLTAATAAVDAVRPITSTFNLYAPVIVAANVAMTITTAVGYTHATVTATVQAAVQAYINSLGIGQTLTFTRLAQVAYDASPGVTNVTAVTLNSGTTDLTATNQQRLLPGTVTVS